MSHKQPAAAALAHDMTILDESHVNGKTPVAYRNVTSNGRIIERMVYIGAPPDTTDPEKIVEMNDQLRRDMERVAFSQLRRNRSDTDLRQASADVVQSVFEEFQRRHENPCRRMHGATRVFYARALVHTAVSSKAKAYGVSSHVVTARAAMARWRDAFAAEHGRDPRYDEMETWGREYRIGRASDRRPPDGFWMPTKSNISTDDLEEGRHRDSGFRELHTHGDMQEVLDQREREALDDIDEAKQRVLVSLSRLSADKRKALLGSCWGPYGEQHGVRIAPRTWDAERQCDVLRRVRDVGADPCRVITQGLADIRAGDFGTPAALVTAEPFADIPHIRHADIVACFDDMGESRALMHFALWQSAVRANGDPDDDMTNLGALIQ